MFSIKTPNNLQQRTLTTAVHSQYPVCSILIVLQKQKGAQLTSKTLPNFRAMVESKGKLLEQHTPIVKSLGHVFKDEGNLWRVTFFIDICGSFLFGEESLCLLHRGQQSCHWRALGEKWKARIDLEETYLSGTGPQAARRATLQAVVAHCPPWSDHFNDFCRDFAMPLPWICSVLGFVVSNLWSKRHYTYLWCFVGYLPDVVW